MDSTSSSVISFFLDLDPARDLYTFYSELNRKVVLLPPAGMQKVLDHSLKSANTSELNSAAHFFAVAMVKIYAAEFTEAIQLLENASAIFSELDHTGGQMACNTLTCVCYRSFGQLDKARVFIQNALELQEGIDLQNMYGYFKGVVFYQAAEINVELKNFEIARGFFESGLKFTKENPELEGRMLSGLGVLYMNQEKWEEAIHYLEESLEKIKELKNVVIESRILTDMGAYYLKRNDPARALQYQEKSLQMRLNNGMRNPAITNYIRLAEVCIVNNDLEKALEYAHKAVENAEQLKVNIKLPEAYHVLSSAYEKMGDVKNAFLAYRKYTQYKEAVHNQEVVRKIEQIQNQYKVQTAEQEKEIFRLRNVELKLAIDEIKESMRYAQRIQNALLPSEWYIRRELNRLNRS